MKTERKKAVIQWLIDDSATKKSMSSKKMKKRESRKRKTLEETMTTSTDDITPDHFLHMVPKHEPTYLSALTPHPRDQRIRFNEDSHTYWVDFGTGEFKCEGVVSVSGFVHDYFSHFDADNIIKKMRSGKSWNTKHAKYHGMTDEQIKAQWAANGKKASEDGTGCHRLLEGYFNGENINAFRHLPRIQQFFKWKIEWFEPRGLVPFRTELRFWSDTTYKLVGTADLIAVKRDHPPPEECGGVLTVTLLDWKFSKKISTYGFDNGTGPCHVLPDCNHSHYLLQQNTYCWFLERFYKSWTYRGHKYTDINVESMHLIVMHESNPNNEAIVIDLPRRFDVLDEMLDDRRCHVAGVAKQARNTVVDAEDVCEDVTENDEYEVNCDTDDEDV
jgi:hypothetical protein